MKKKNERILALEAHTREGKRVICHGFQLIKYGGRLLFQPLSHSQLQLCHWSIIGLRKRICYDKKL